MKYLLIIPLFIVVIILIASFKPKYINIMQSKWIKFNKHMSKPLNNKASTITWVIYGAVIIIVLIFW